MDPTQAEFQRINSNDAEFPVYARGTQDPARGIAITVSDNEVSVIGNLAAGLVCIKIAGLTLHLNEHAARNFAQQIDACATAVDERNAERAAARVVS